MNPNINKQMWDKGVNRGYELCTWRHEEAIQNYNAVKTLFIKYQSRILTPEGLIAELNGVFKTK